jgi:hypothetical protein
VLLGGEAARVEADLGEDLWTVRASKPSMRVKSTPAMR